MGGIGIYISNYLMLLVLASVFILVGRLFYKNKAWTFKESFFSLFGGIIALSTTTAVIKTGGLTIMLGFVLLGTLLLYERRKNLIAETKKDASNNKMIILGLLVGSVFVYTWSFLMIGQFDAFPYHIPNGTAMSSNDYIINTFRSYYLGINGEENYYHALNTMDSAYHGPKPYHYLEMWTTVGVTSIFGGLTAAKFILIANPLYYLAAFTGVMAIWERFTTVKWYHIIGSMLCMFIAGLHLSFYSALGIPDFSLPIFTHRLKMSVYYIFFLGFLLQFNKEKPQQSILILLGLMIATIVSAPALIGGFMCYAAFMMLKNKGISISTTGYTIGMAAFIFLFYKLTDTGQLNIRANAGASELTSNLLAVLADDPIGKIGILFKALVGHGVLYLPLILLAIVMYLEDSSMITNGLPLLIISMGILLSGAVAYAIFKEQLDANQLFYNMANPLLNCLLITAAIKFITSQAKQIGQTKWKWNHAVLGVMFLLIFSKQTFAAAKRNIAPSLVSTAYSDDYLNKVKDYITADETINLGASIKGGDDYKSQFSKQTAAYTLGYYLAYMENGSIALQISDFDVPDLDKSDEEDMKSSLFYRYVELQKEKRIFSSIGNAQAAFIDEYGIDFIVISRNGELRKEVESLIAIEIRDDVSGERFLVLKNTVE